MTISANTNEYTDVRSVNNVSSENFATDDFTIQGDRVVNRMGHRAVQFKSPLRNGYGRGEIPLNRDLSQELSLSDHVNYPIVMSSRHPHSTSIGRQEGHMGQDPVSFDTEGILLSVQALRAMPAIKQAVSDRLMQYLQASKDEMIRGKNLSKRTKSGCYNTQELVSVEPQLRWPNEGCLAGIGNKRPSLMNFQLHNLLQGF